MREVKFICMDKECMKEGQFPCVLSFYTDDFNHCDYPSYCPYELEPDETKYKKWVKIIE